MKGKWSNPRFQRATAAATEQLRVAGRAAVALSSNIWRDLVSTPDTLYFNLIYVQNNSFQQQITFQPVIECMYAANYR